ncbi:hypothetical protein MAXJ12_03523 [Mesorhizobium alhagi CCNWXJ12-2]|uniref:Uncharacterized protein n=1 Tax=Mesorhizobium alhagi CCNWXJ12-2 TaxID=1107882 RepID=H0HKP7_9HYPH|nr:hypothetical protein MAXJ12_03523 [Mesorhizobium alhagi CCNWXJ12-2]
MESAGVELHSEDKPRYLGTILWREKERFTNIAGQGYVMSDMVTEQPSIMDLIGRAADEEETKNDEKDKSAFD